jgi:hypothetical protein
MTGMPKYWLNKIPAMLAMDRYFSGSDRTALAQRYTKAINSLQHKPNVWTSPGDSIAGMGGNLQDTMDHFDADWLNLNNLSSGGHYWPHIPTFQILVNLRQGIIAGATKGLGWTHLANAVGGALPPPSLVFEKELDPDEGAMQPSELEEVLPMVTSWVCTSPPGTGGFQVDAVRGPSVVEVIIATPWPMPQSRLWPVIAADLDAIWNIIHPTDDIDLKDVIANLPPWPQKPGEDPES